MKIRDIFLGAGVLAVVCMAAPRADASEVLYNGVGFMMGTQSFTDSFSVSSPGTLTVTLGNVGWPQPLSSLNLVVSSTSAALGTMNASNSTSLTSNFDVQSGNLFAQWYGTAQSSGLDAGVYSLEIQFTPIGGTAPVPLPTSIALLLSGLGLLIWQRRTRGPGHPDAAGGPRNLSNGEDPQTA